MEKDSLSDYFWYCSLLRQFFSTEVVSGWNTSLLSSDFFLVLWRKMVCHHLTPHLAWWHRHGSNLASIVQELMRLKRKIPTKIWFSWLKSFQTTDVKTCSLLLLHTHDKKIKRNPIGTSFMKNNKRSN